MLQPTYKPASTLNTSKVFMDKQSNTYNLQVISNASKSLANISKYQQIQTISVPFGPQCGCEPIVCGIASSLKEMEKGIRQRGQERKMRNYFQRHLINWKFKAYVTMLILWSSDVGPVHGTYCIYVLDENAGDFSAGCSG